MTQDDSTSEGLTETVGRRTFLKVLGSAAPAVAMTACSPVPPERIIPFVVPPEDVVPGVASWYASVCGECPAGCGVLVRTREGRAVKVEGNPEHPINRGSLCVRGHASLQGLYNPDRIAGPQRRRTTNASTGHSVLEPVDWEQAQQQLVDQLQTVRGSGPGRIAIVTPLTTGTLDHLVTTWAVGVGARRVTYEPFAYEAIRAANRTTFGHAAVPYHDFSSPDVVVSFGADFQETWLSTVGHTRDLSEGRRVQDGRKSRFVQIEPRMSLTGASADEWIEIRPGTEGLVAAAMARTIVDEARIQGPALDAEPALRLAELLADYTPERVADATGLSAARIRALARSFSDPAAGPGRSLAVGSGIAACGDRATVAQIAINLLNYVAGNIGSTVVFGPDMNWGQAGTYRDMVELTNAMRAGDIELLILHDVNPVHTMPGGAAFAAALDEVPFVVSISSFPDETSTRADLVLPTHTPLESWGDSVPRKGVRGLMQPVMRPVFDTKHVGDILLDSARALGPDVSADLPRRGDFLALLQQTWEELQPTPEADPNATDVPPGPDFDDFWAEAQRRGGFFEAVDPISVELTSTLFDQGLEIGPATTNRALELMVYPSLHYYDGRGANRPWLQEIPDPMMKTTWSSWVEASTLTAGTIGAEEGQLVRLTSEHGTLDVSLLINDQLREGVVAMPIGQGHTSYGRYAAGRGVNPLTLLSGDPEPDSGGRRWLTGVGVIPLEVTRRIPRLQTSFDQQDRGIAQTVSLATLVAGDIEPEAEHFSLSPEHEHPIHRWGMAIDLDSCNGCNACVAACYAENNIPVVGQERIRHGRTMSWLRIERFVEQHDTQVDNRFLPMLCQHCDHAPCETVCPVFATYHTDEGLNAQVYNRCVGTRYCANNCPYRVRRFNWSAQEFPEPLNLQLNPDVTARVSGVMEKCTFCVQRITDGKGDAKDEGRTVQDGDVTPACAQTCPAQAIVFGDMNDPESRVSQLSEDARAYHVLGELNTRPAITYLKKVTQA